MSENSMESLRRKTVTGKCVWSRIYVFVHMWEKEMLDYNLPSF